MAPLKDQVVLITGCSSGMGRAMAREFAARGHTVVATARRAESLGELEKEGFITQSLDVCDSESIEKAITGAIDKCGRIDMLVNNAGYGLVGPIAELEIADLRHQFETNVFGAVACAQAVFLHMKQNGHGRIVNIGSISGVVTSPFAGAYCSSKAALHSLMEALRLEVEPFGIDVITVQPGGIKSNFGDSSAKTIERYQNPDSHYYPIADAIEKRARASQKSPMTAEQFATKTVSAVLRKNPPIVFRVAREAFVLPAIQTLFPKAATDKLMRNMFRLDDLKSNK